MTTCTPIYGFVYAECADRPCDIGATFCEFADQVETELDRLDAIVDRTIDTIPFAQVKFPGSQVVVPSGTGTVVFDTVVADTDNMVNLEEDSTLITITRTGTWVLSFSAALSTVGSGAAGSALFSSSTSSDGYIDNGVTTPYFPSFSSIIRVVSASGVFGDVVAPALIRIFAGAGLATTVTDATLTVAWMGDE